MGSEIVRYNELSELMALGDVFAQSGMFADAQDKAKAVVKILAGQELGFGAFASMAGVRIIRGNVALSANLMASAVKRSGKYTYRVLTMEPDICKIEFFERDGGQWVSIGVSPFTIEDAHKAGTQNMNKFPRNMLFARAMSNGVRWFCPDVTGGPAYTPEELGEEVDEDGDMVRIERLPAASLPVEEDGMREARVDRIATICVDCGTPLANYSPSPGEMVGPGRVAKRNLAKFGRVLCMNCANTIDRLLPRAEELDKALILLDIPGPTFEEEWSADKLRHWLSDASGAFNNRLEKLSEESGTELDDGFYVLPIPEKVRQGLEMREVIAQREMADEAQR